MLHSSLKKGFTGMVGARQCRLAIVLCVVWTLPTGADSVYEIPPNVVSNQTREEFIIGNLEFILLHEMAHLILGEKAVPVLGPEENAADYIAATFLLRGDNGSPDDRRRLRKYVESAAYAFAILWEHEQSVGTRVPYWASHALGIQRYYRLMCLLAGSNPDFVNSSPAFGAITDDRVEACDVEYAKADRAVQWLLDNYGRGEGEPTGEPVEIVYQDTGSQLQKTLMVEIRKRRLVELTINAMTERFALERPLRVVMRVCHRPAAIWNPETGELTLCYDLIDAFRQIYRIGLRAR